MSALMGLVRSLADGQGGLALVEGPPGIGKTRLVAESGRLAAKEGITVASGVADELDQMTPWRSLLDALSSTDPAIVTQGQLLSGTGLLDRRLEVLECIRGALEGAAERAPLVIVLDDLQWADPLTIVALGSLALQLFSYPILWLLSRRTFPAPGQLEALIDRLDRQGILRVPLEPLGARDTTALATDLLGRTPDARVDRMIAHAEGNPLYVVEIVRGAREEWQRAQKGMGSDARAARSLTAVVLDHLRSLSEPPRHLIKLAAVLGPSFSVAELSAVSGQPASDLVQPISEALAAGVLVEDGPALAFRHDLFRQAVYGELPASLRLALHRDAATALLATGASAVRVANHLATAAVPGDETAIETLGRAIGELFGTSPRAAADLALRVLDVADEAHPGRAMYLATAVQLLGWAGRLDEARALGEKYIAEHELPVSLEAEIELGIRRAWVMSTSRAYPTPLPSRLVTDEAVPAAVRANLITFDQDTAMFDKPAEDVRGALRRAHQLVEGYGDGSDLAIVQSIGLTLEQEHGHLLEALAIAESPLTGVRRPSDRAGAIRDSNIASALATAGRPREALESLAVALAEASSSGHTIITSRCQSTRAMALLELGRVEDARAEAEAAAELAESLGFGYYLGQALVTLAEAAIRQGDLTDAKTAADRLSERSPDEPTADAAWAAALCADATGRHTAALELLGPMIERLSRNRFMSASWYPSRLPQLVGLAMRAGASDQAGVAADAAGELSRRNPDLATCRGSALHARGLLRSDRALLRSAVDVLADGERPLATAAAREDLARLLGRAGAKPEAITHLEAAYETYVQAGAGRDTARARAALRSLGVRKRQPSVARKVHGWESLTKSEARVVDLVARGMTNREAASELFLSPDTINAHLKHAFTKLGIHSRVQLARLAADREHAAAATSLPG